MALTPDRQRNAVSEGAALGLVMSGRTTIPYEKFRVDLAFNGAWRGWQYTDQFPRVTTDLKNMEGTRALIHVDRNRSTKVLYWDNSGRDLSICARDDEWDPSDESEVQYALNVIGGDVPLDGWVSLAKDFLNQMA